MKTCLVTYESGMNVDQINDLFSRKNNRRSSKIILCECAVVTQHKLLVLDIRMPSTPFKNKIQVQGIIKWWNL